MTNSNRSELLKIKMRQYLPDKDDIMLFSGVVKNLARENHEYLGISVTAASDFISALSYGNLLPSQNSPGRIREYHRRLSLILEKFGVSAEDPLVGEIKNKLSERGLNFIYPPGHTSTRELTLEEKLVALKPECRKYVEEVINECYRSR